MSSQRKIMVMERQDYNEIITENDRLRSLKTKLIYWLIEVGRPLEARELSERRIISDEHTADANSNDINVSRVISKYHIPSDIFKSFLVTPEDSEK